VSLTLKGSKMYFVCTISQEGNRLNVTPKDHMLSRKRKKIKTKEPELSNTGKGQRQFSRWQVFTDTRGQLEEMFPRKNRSDSSPE
jgi:hypothetical protein